MSGDPHFGTRALGLRQNKRKKDKAFTQRKREAYVSLPLSPSFFLSKERSLVVTVLLSSSHSGLKNLSMIEYQNQLAIIRKVQKGRNVQVEFVSKTSKSKDFLFLFFSETTSFPPLANTNTHTHTPDKVDKRYISKQEITVSFRKDHPVTVYMHYYFNHKECWSGSMNKEESELYHSAVFNEPQGNRRALLRKRIKKWKEHYVKRLDEIKGTYSLSLSLSLSLTHPPTHTHTHTHRCGGGVVKS